MHLQYKLESSREIFRKSKINTGSWVYNEFSREGRGIWRVSEFAEMRLEFKMENLHWVCTIIFVLISVI